MYTSDDVAKPSDYVAKAVQTTYLVLCSRSLVVTEGVAAPRDQGAATSNGNAIARSRNKDMWDADAAEWQQTSATQQQVVPDREDRVYVG